MSGAWCAGHCAPPAHHDQDQRRGQTPEPCHRFGCRLWVWSGPRISGCIENPSGVIGSFEPGSRLTVYENAPAPALLQQSRATPRQRPFTAGGMADWVLPLRQWCVRARTLRAGGWRVTLPPYTRATSSLSMRRSSRSITSNRQPFRVKVSPRAGRRRRWLITRPATVS